MQNMRDHLSGKSPAYEAIYRIKAKNGSYKWYYDKGGIVKWNITGKPEKVVGLVVDVTEIKNIEDDLIQKK
jgi:PAS domain S-box-containing protein